MNKLSLSVFTALAALLLAPAANAEPFRIIVTHLEPPLVPNSVLDLALQEGYFERAGVDVELIRVQQTPSALAALRAGDGEMANISTDALLQLVAQGVELTAVSSPNRALPFIIAARDEITEPAQLEGRVFGIGRVGSLDHSLSTKVLQNEGLDTETMEFVSIGQPNVRAEALLNGLVDATTMSIGVFLSIPEKDGIHILIDQDPYYQAAPVISKVNAVTAEVLETRRDDVVAVTRALVEISRDFAADPEAWVNAMEKALPHIAREELEFLADSFVDSWTVDGGMTPEELEFTAEWIYETEDFADVPLVALDDWADFSILGDVMAEIGTASAGNQAQ